MSTYNVCVAVLFYISVMQSKKCSTPSAASGITLATAVYRPPYVKFLSSFGRKINPIVGDGNCLFRCFSYIFFGNQDRHQYLRAILADVIALNKPAFTIYCLPKTVGNHVSLMKHLSVWGTHMEILAMAAYTKSPVYTAISAIQKNAENDDSYYWAQYKISDTETSRIIHPTDSHQDCLMAERLIILKFVYSIRVTMLLF